MNHFELVCILKPDLSKQSQDQVEENMKKYINESGGKIVDQEIWGLKNLAYPIKLVLFNKLRHLYDTFQLKFPNI